MACLLTKDYTFVGCKDQLAGISEVLICEYDFVNISSMTVAAGIVTALTCATGKKFRRYILDKERGEYSFDLTGNKETGINTYLHKVMFTTNKITTDMVLEMDLVAKNWTIIIVKEADGTYRMYGREKGMELVTGGINSAKELGGFKGQVWTFESIQPSHALEVQSSLITTLLSPAV